ncbi:prohibitin family protein, partial [Campylobacter sp. JMF_08 NE1]|nr:prohibitin family protein [Campylobacter sp. JMF_08 NE1]
MPADLNDYFNKRGSNGGGNGGGENRKFNFKTPNLPNFSKFSGLLYVIIGIIAVLIIAKPFVTIQSGEVGIKANLGKFDKDPLGAGLHFFLPF